MQDVTNGKLCQGEFIFTWSVAVQTLPLPVLCAGYRKGAPWPFWYLPGDASFSKWLQWKNALEDVHNISVTQLPDPFNSTSANISVRKRKMLMWGKKGANKPTYFSYKADVGKNLQIKGDNFSQTVNNSLEGSIVCDMFTQFWTRRFFYSFRLYRPSTDNEDSECLCHLLNL